MLKENEKKYYLKRLFDDEDVDLTQRPLFRMAEQDLEARQLFQECQEGHFSGH